MKEHHYMYGHLREEVSFEVTLLCLTPADTRIIKCQRYGDDIRNYKEFLWAWLSHSWHQGIGEPQRGMQMGPYVMMELTTTGVGLITTHSRASVH